MTYHSRPIAVVCRGREMILNFCSAQLVGCGLDAVTTDEVDELLGQKQ